MSTPVVAIALHDGYFSAGTGAGRSNRALINTIATALAPGIHLVLLPVLLQPASPEYDRAGHQAVQARLARHGLPRFPTRSSAWTTARAGCGVSATWRPSSIWIVTLPRESTR